MGCRGRNSIRHPVGHVSCRNRTSRVAIFLGNRGIGRLPSCTGGLSLCASRRSRVGVSADWGTSGREKSGPAPTKEMEHPVRIEPVLSALLALNLTLATASPPVIGTVVAKGSFRVDEATVTGNATLFEGATVETGPVTSTLD